MKNMRENREGEYNAEYPEDENPLEDTFEIEELVKGGVHLSVSGTDLLESGKSAGALKYSARRERPGLYNPKASNPPQRSAQIGEIIQFARYGDVPRTGESYDYRDQVGLDGLSVYHIIDGKEDKVGWYFGFTDRPRHEGIGRVVGYGPDGEPLVRVLMLDGEFYEPEIDLDWEALQYSSPEKGTILGATRTG